MKVLFITNYPSPYRVNFFNELGKEVEVTVTYDKKPDEQKERGGQWDAWFDENYTHFNAIYLSNSIQVLSVIRKGKFDLIVSGGYATSTCMLAIQYAKMRKNQLLIEVDGMLVGNENKFKYKIKRHFVSGASGWISSGEISTKNLIHYGADISKIYKYSFSSLNKSDIITEMLSKEEKAAQKAELAIKEKKMVLAVGRFIPCKGFDVLMNAASNLSKDIGVYFVGGEPTEEYVQMQNELNLKNVHFIGFKSKHELQAYYRAADVFALPTRGDVWGLVINEAMANGLPIVTTNKCVAGLELVKNDVNGYIVPVENARAISDSLQKILSSPKRCDEMGKTSLVKIAPYTIENMVQEHLKIFETRCSQI